MRHLRRSSAVVLFSLLGGTAVACGTHEDGSIGEDQAAISTTSTVSFPGSGGTGGTTGSTTGTISGTGGTTTTTSTTTGGGTGGGGIGPDGGFFGPAQPIGFWKFDDCNPKSAVLLDSSGNGNTANRSGTTTCVPSIDGLAVGFAKAKDAVTVADSPAFNFTSHVAVAAWINPTTVSGTQTIVDQQFQGKTTFALSIKSGMVQFSVTLQTGKTVTSSAPISANTWSHVAGSYDGQFVFLYLDGQQVGQVDLPGAVREANGPITIGNNAANQHFDGAIDDVWLSVDPVQLSDITALSCIAKPATAVATPAAGPPVPFDSSVNYTTVVTNNNAGFCSPSSYFFQVQSPPGFTTQQQQFFAQNVPPGGTASFPFTVSVGEQPDPGIYTIPYFVQDFSNFSNFIQGQVTFDLTAPSGCFVFTGRELMMLDTSIVEDPIRTTWNGPAGDPRTGVWTFASLMERMAPTPGQASAMVSQLLSNWLTDQQVGGFTVPARTQMQQLILDPWPKLPDGSLDLTKAPLRLSAIVNRMDVRNLDQGKAGEGRFVFSFLDPFGNPLQFTLIVEYNLPATTDADVQTWANRWHALSSNPFPSEQYNAALQAVTDAFTGRGVTPGQPNGSALAQLRTNEIALSFEWELREFHLDPTSGFLVQAGTALTPDLSLNGSPLVADYVNQNQSTILQQLHVVPASFEGQPFQAGSSLNPIAFWSAPGIVDNDARQLFSLNTCNGCHGQETGTGFLHIAPRFPGQQSQLSGFLTGITVQDPVSFQPRTFGDLAARKADLTSLVCTSPTSSTVVQKAARSALLRHGRRSVH